MITLKSDLFHLKERTRGFIEAYRARNSKDPLIMEIPEEDLHSEIAGIIEEAQKNNVDALYFSTNKIAIEGLSVLARKKIKVPEEMGVICFDEADAYKLFPSTISFVKQPLKHIGKQAVQKLLEENARTEQIILGAQLIKGDSSSKQNN